MNEEYKKKIIKACRDIVGPAPGSPFNYLWLGNGSCLSSVDLRIIADEIDRMDEGANRMVAEEMDQLNKRQDGEQQDWLDEAPAPLQVRTVSKPGAVLEVVAVPIPPKIQSKMAEAIREEKR